MQHQLQGTCFSFHMYNTSSSVIISSLECKQHAMYTGVQGSHAHTSDNRLPSPTLNPTA